MKDEVLELMRQHRSVRKYKRVELADAVTRRCVASAQMAATSSNVQGYGVVQVKDGSTRELLVELSGGQPQVAEAGAFFVVCADQRRHRLMATDQALAFESNLESLLVDTIDASLFAQNLCLAFEAQGLGTCFIGGLRNDLPRLCALLELPADVFPLFGLCVGEAEDAGEVKPRLATDAVLFVDRYPGVEEMREQIAEYDERMAEYYAERGLAGRDWSGGVVRKFKQARREDLIGFFEEQGARFR